jgi:hypothetical protein
MRCRSRLATRPGGNPPHSSVLRAMARHLPANCIALLRSKHRAAVYMALYLAVSTCWAQAVADPRCGQQLVIVSVWEDEATPAELVTAYEKELRTIVADLGVNFRLATLDEATRGSFAGRIVVLRMLWKASPARSEIDTLPNSALAWTHATSGNIKPFAAVDLAALQRFLGLAPLRMGMASASQALGIATARVGAHEIYHMLTRSADHSKEGIMRPALSPRDLLGNHAPAWTEENRLVATQLIGSGGTPIVAAVSGAQSREAGKK